MRATVILIVLVGCFSKPDAPNVLDGSAAIDSIVDDASTDSSNGCTGAPWDDFENGLGEPCGQWGFADNASALTRSGTDLRIAPIGPAGTDAGCQTQPFNVVTHAGSIQLLVPLNTNAGDTTRFTLDLQGNIEPEIRVLKTASGLEITFVCPGAQADFIRHDASHLWLKFTGSGNTVTAWHSNDAVQWEPFNPVCTVNTTVGSGTLKFGAMLGAGTTAAAAVFDNLNVKTCP